ncbi:MAG: hypothetical protein FJW32_23780 [Acidobacteria bacterium]|nr:hypothetical protein [Acidobacteriota bacterium]
MERGRHAQRLLAGIEYGHLDVLFEPPHQAQVVLGVVGRFEFEVMQLALGVTRDNSDVRVPNFGRFDVDPLDFRYAKNRESYSA